MLTLARLALKAPANFKWFGSWIWPLVNGIKPIDKAFPLIIDTDTICSKAEKEAMQAELWKSIQGIQGELTESQWATSWAFKSELEDEELRALSKLNINEFIPTLFGKVPLITLTKMCGSMQALQRGEITPFQYTVQMKRHMALHSESLVPILLQSGLSNDAFLSRYLRDSAKKRKTATSNLTDALDSLFAQIQLEAQEKELSKKKNPKQEYKEKVAKERSEREENRKFGTKHELYVTLTVERISGIDDYGGEDLRLQHVFHRTGAYTGVEIAPSPKLQEMHAAGELPAEEAAGHDIGGAKESSASQPIDASSSIRKIFIENIPDAVDERDIALALRNCGDIKRVWLHRSEGPQGAHNFGAVGNRQSFFKDEFKNETVAETYYSQVKKLAAAKGPIQEEKVFYHPTDPNVDKYLQADNTVVIEEVSKEQAEEHILNEKLEPVQLKQDNEEWEKLLHARPDDGMVKLKNASKSSGSGGAGELLEELSVDLEDAHTTDDDFSFMGETEGTSLKYVVAQMLKEETSEERQKLNKKSAALKKRVARTKRNYNYAYVLLNDDDAYYRATRDEMRIFGMYIDGYSCRVQESARLRTLIVEIIGPNTCDVIRSHLIAVLGPWYSINLPQSQYPYANYRNGTKPLQWADVAEKKPVFVHLEFPSHEEAWKGFEALTQASQDGAPLGVSWVKSQLYWKVARKAKEMAFDSKSKRVGLEMEEAKKEA